MLPFLNVFFLLFVICIFLFCELYVFFESTIKVGDWIWLENWNGIVLEIGIHTTKIRY